MRGCNCSANKHIWGDYERFRRTDKQTLYHLHWTEKIEVEDIAEQYNVTTRYVRRWFNKIGLQYATTRNGSSHNHRNRFIFDRRKRSHYYELYWGCDLNYSEIAELKGISEHSVARVFRDKNIARLPQSYGKKWYDKERGIPQQFKLPRDSSSHSDASRTSSDDASQDSLPKNPDPNKYLAETPTHRDKDRLYELHWRYGCSVAHIQAMVDTECDIRDCMRQLGIPLREYAEHKDWEPHHKQVPPMFQWPHDQDYDDEEPFEWSLSNENMVVD